jgi:hypothetical protein
VNTSEQWFTLDSGSRSTTVMAGTEGQGVGSSNLASPTVKDLMGANLLGCKGSQDLEMGTASGTFQDSQIPNPATA